MTERSCRVTSGWRSPGSACLPGRHDARRRRWPPCWPAGRWRRPITDVRRVRPHRPLRLRGRRLRPRGDRRCQGGSPDRPGQPARHRRRRGGARCRPVWTRPGEVDPARVAVLAGTGVGGLTTLEDQIARAGRAGPEPGQPVPRADDDDERHGRPAVDASRLHRRQPLHLDGVRVGGQRHRRRPADDPLRAEPTSCWPAAPRPPSPRPRMAAFARMGALSGRNDDPAARLPAVRPRSRRLRHGRRRGVPGARALGRSPSAGVRRSSGSWPATARPATPITSPRPRPDGAGAVACMRQALDDAGLAPGRRRPRQRPRHVDPAQRPRRERSPGQGVRRRRAAGHLDQGRHRPPRRRGRCGRGRARRCSPRPQGQVPPTANLDRRSIPRSGSTSWPARPATIAPAPVLSNSFGFGGHNATLVLVPAG